jgi:hypothetical protein
LLETITLPKTVIAQVRQIALQRVISREQELKTDKDLTNPNRRYGFAHYSEFLNLSEDPTNPQVNELFDMKQFEELIK